MPDHIKEKINPAELTYYNNYLESIDEYNRSLSMHNNIDLTVDMKPPKDLFIEVRIKQDYGTVMLPESGQVNLQKNTTHLLRRSEVDHLIKQGIVAEVM
jgi:GINS complex subunit 1